MLVTTYGIYLAISLGLTVWVAQTLHKNGRVFLVDVFDAWAAAEGPAAAATRPQA